MKTFKQEELNQSIELYQKICSPGKEIFGVQRKYTDEDFNQSFNSNKINKTIFENCRSLKTNFYGTSGSYSNFINCSFIDCNIKDSNMTFCDFTQAQLYNRINYNIWGANDFSYSIFKNSKLESLDFMGTSFFQTTFENAYLNSLVFQHCCFDSIDFSRTTIENIDFSNIEVHSCVFAETIFRNTTFTLTMLINNYGLLPYLLNSDSGINVVIGQQHKVISSNKAVEYVNSLKPFFEANNEFLPLCNISLCFEHPKISIEKIKDGITYAIKSNDFVLVLRLCKAAVYSKVFAPNILSDIYKLINSSIDTKKLKYNEIKKYLQCIDELRYMLLINPMQTSTLHLTIQTNITDDNTFQLGNLLNSIEENIYDIDSTINPIFQIQKHSPYEILITVCATAAVLLPVSQLFNHIINSIKLSQDILEKNKKDDDAIKDINGDTDCTPDVQYHKTHKKFTFGKLEVSFTSEQIKSYQSIESIKDIVDE